VKIPGYILHKATLDPLQNDQTAKGRNTMNPVRNFLKKKNIELSPRKYFIDALSAMAQGLFCTLLVGTILNTIGKQFNISFLTKIIATLKAGDKIDSFNL
jgi:hypothetical protein